jgi:hypothetical protein
MILLKCIACGKPHWLPEEAAFNAPVTVFTEGPRRLLLMCVACGHLFVFEETGRSRNMDAADRALLARAPCLQEIRADQQAIVGRLIG